MYSNLSYYEAKNYTSLTDKAYDILEEAIVTMELAPGQLYSERYLSEFTGIGRSPVREALKRLEPTHIIESIPRSGITISLIRLEECYLQMEVRSMLEKLVCVRAAKFSTPNERIHFRHLADAYEEATQRDNALEAIRIDNEFNIFVSDCSRNIFAKTALMPLHTLARRLYFMQYYFDQTLTKKINASHCELMRAIAEGKNKDTLIKMDELIQNIKMLTVSTMDTSALGLDFSKNYDI